MGPDSSGTAPRNLRFPALLVSNQAVANWGDILRIAEPAWRDLLWELLLFRPRELCSVALLWWRARS